MLWILGAGKWLDSGPQWVSRLFLALHFSIRACLVLLLGCRLASPNSLSVHMAGRLRPPLVPDWLVTVPASLT